MTKPPPDLGALALSMGWITREALDDALAFQKASSEGGQAPRLGQILVDRKHITAAQLRALLTLQGKGIVVCPGCKKQYNASSFRIGASVKCPNCGTTFGATGAAVENPAVDGTVILLDDALAKTEIRRPDDGKLGVPKQFGKYQVIDEIARGGMGVVYRAQEMGLGRHVALKVLIAGEEAGQDQIDRFIREARSAAKLRHPNIVAIHDVGVEHGHHYFTMDLIEGCSIETLVRERIAIQPADALRIARDVAYALHYAHQHGIVHRDMKPGNILLEFAGGARPIPRNEEPSAGDSNRFTEKDLGATRKGLFQLRPEDRVYLTDFGLAKEVGAESTRLTRTGMTMGTPAYMSPEQARGRIDEVEARSDVFALGSVLYEMITGRPPFRGDSIIDVMMRVASKDPDPVRKLNPQIHPDIETICLKALEKDKDRRYASALAMAADIESYLGGEAISARPQGIAFRVRKSIRRNAALAAAVSVTAMAITLAFVIPRNVLPWIHGIREERRLALEREKARAREAKIEGEALALVRNAEQLHAEGKFHEALDAANTAAIGFPAPSVRPQAWFVAARAQAAIDQGRVFVDAAHDPASRLYALAYVVGAETQWGPRAILAIARRLAERHDHARAVTVLQRLLQRFPDAAESDDARVALARALAAVGHPDQGAALFSQGDPPSDTSSLRALLTPFGQIRRDPLGAQFSHIECRSSGTEAEVHLAREGELITVSWREGALRVQRQPLPPGAPLDVVTDGREVHCVLRGADGALLVATRSGETVALDPSWKWRGGSAACADLDADGTAELCLPLGRPEPLPAVLRQGGKVEPLDGLSLTKADAVDLRSFSRHGGADGLVVSARIESRGEVRVISASTGGRTLLSPALPVEGLIGIGATTGEVIAVRARDGRVGVIPLAWKDDKLIPSDEIRLEVQASKDCVAHVTTLPGTPPPVLVRLEGGAEEAILLLKRPKSGAHEWLEVGAPQGGGPVFPIGSRLVWVERHGSTLASTVEGGKAAPPPLPRLSPKPTDLELAQDLLDIGLPDQALEVLQQFLTPLEAAWDNRTQSRPIAEAYLARARALAARGDLDPAFDALDRAERASSQDMPRALRLRADLLLAAGKRDLAAPPLERLLLEGGLSEGDAERVRQELEFVRAWSSARRLVEEDFSRGRVSGLAGNLLAGDPFRSRVVAGALALRPSNTCPAWYGVPLHLDGKTFEASASLILPPSTAAARVEWGIFREGVDAVMIAGAIAEGQGTEVSEGYRWSVAVPDAPAPEEAGRWPLNVVPQAELVLSYESRTRRIELRVGSGAGDAPVVVWASALASDFPAGSYRFGVRTGPCTAPATRGEVKTCSLSFRAVTLASSIQESGGTAYERGCGFAVIGEIPRALVLLGQVDPLTSEARLARAALLAETPGRTEEALQTMVRVLQADRSAAVRALGELLPSMRPEGAAVVLDALAQSSGGLDRESSEAAIRAAREKGDTASLVANLASRARAEAADAELGLSYAEALSDMGQPALAAEQAGRMMRLVPDPRNELRRRAIDVLWHAWLGCQRDVPMLEELRNAEPIPAVLVRSVSPEGVASAAGLLAGDRILAIGGQELWLVDQFREEYDGALCAGKTSLALRVWREGRELRLNLPIGPLGLGLREEWMLKPR